MTAQRISYGVETLALAMLPLLKAQSRIDRDDEDAQAQEMIARSIGRIERQCGIAIAPQEWTWMPRDPDALVAWNDTTAWPLSRVPVRGFSAITGVDTLGDPITDIRLRGNTEQGAFAVVHLSRAGGVQSGDLYTIVAGWDDPANMPPELRDTVIRYAATFWEHREAWQLSGVTSDVPEWVTEALGIFWVPVV